MRNRHLFITTALALASFTASEARQPYGGCWFPDDILHWTPQTDPDLKFNRSRVPLAARFREPEPMKANCNQHYEGQICNATILFNICSRCPSQGAMNFVGYQPTYWQYMDKLVYWAGSAPEGIIIPPPAGSTDAAHAQGVKVLGQVFFPPAVFGGREEWVRQMLTRENGRYIYAMKLHEIARELGFDGWFINEETGGGTTEEWKGFIREFNKAAKDAGDAHMEIQWYDAIRTPNLPLLSTGGNTSQFLEYGSEYDNSATASSLGWTREERFSKLYSGVETVKTGLTGYNDAINGAFPPSGHVGSLALFCPEEHIWKGNVRELLGTPDEKGEKAYEAIARTFANEATVWVNRSGDPSDISDSEWRGISGAVLERSTITGLPFLSNFCVGVGKYRFVDGEKEGTGDWYHSGVQSILPTWRWWIENRGDIKVSVDWEDAYNHGSSFRFTGITSGSHLVRLYKTMILIQCDAMARIVFKGESAPKLLLSTASTVNPDIRISPSTVSDENGWKEAVYSLKSLKGKTLHMVAIDLEGVGPQFSLGQLAMLPESYSPEPVNLRNAMAETGTAEDGATDLRVTWDFNYNNDFDHFDIYTVSGKDDRRTLVGQTRDAAFYIPEIATAGPAKPESVEIVPVTKDARQQTSMTAVIN